MKNIMKKIHALCTPAYVYLGVSILGFISMLIQNCNDISKYKAGAWETKVPCHNITFFIFKAIYILFWTVILDKLCKNGYRKLAWFFFLMPLIFMFAMIGLFILIMMKVNSTSVKEGMSPAEIGKVPDVIPEQSMDPAVQEQERKKRQKEMGIPECVSPEVWDPTSGTCTNPILV